LQCLPCLNLFACCQVADSVVYRAGAFDVLFRSLFLNGNAYPPSSLHSHASNPLVPSARLAAAPTSESAAPSGAIQSASNAAIGKYQYTPRFTPAQCEDLRVIQASGAWPEPWQVLERYTELSDSEDEHHDSALAASAHSNTVSVKPEPDASSAASTSSSSSSSASASAAPAAGSASSASNMDLKHSVNKSSAAATAPGTSRPPPATQNTSDPFAAGVTVRVEPMTPSRPPQPQLTPIEELCSQSDCMFVIVLRPPSLCGVSSFPPAAGVLCWLSGSRVPSRCTEQCRPHSLDQALPPKARAAPQTVSRAFSSHSPS
jgi:hypothetical protein